VAKVSAVEAILVAAAPKTKPVETAPAAKKAPAGKKEPAVKEAAPKKYTAKERAAEGTCISPGMVKREKADMAQELEELRALVQKQELAAQGKATAKSAGAKRKVDVAATHEAPGTKIPQRQQEEAERNAEKRRREQAEEVESLKEDEGDSEEENEELPQEWAWSPSKGAGIAPGELQLGQARVVLMVPEDCPEPGETR
jgi:phage protein D